MSATLEGMEFAAVRTARSAGVLKTAPALLLWHIGGWCSSKLRGSLSPQGLKVAYDHLIGSQFEEVLKEADVAEQHLAQSGANGGLHQSVAGRAVKTSDIILLKRPRIFNLAIGWESAQVCVRPLCCACARPYTCSRWPDCPA